MSISTDLSSSSSSGTIDYTNLAPVIENLSLSSPSSIETSSSIDYTNLTSSSFLSSSMIEVISDIDLLTLILTCLPVKSLLLFKSVSKQWFSIISDPIFAVNNYRRLNPKITGLFFESMISRQSSYEVIYNFLLLDGSRFEQGHEGKEEVTRFERVQGEENEKVTNTVISKTPRKFDNDPEPGEYGDIEEFRVRISQSCNGLLCCNRQTALDMDMQYILPSTYKTYIYNPTTRQYRCLPPSPFRDNVPKRDDCFIKVCSISLAFDPIKSMDQHYQVVCIWRYEPYNSIHPAYWDEGIQNKYYLEIYSSKTNSWRKLNSPSTNPFHGLEASFLTSGVYWNGCLHWIASGRYANVESSMYFNVDQELVKPLPASPNAHESNVMYFGECGGHLYLIELLDSCYTHYNILRMETDYSGWKHIHKLDLENLINLYPMDGWRDVAFHDLKFIWRTILLLEEDEAETLSKLVVAAGNEVISYDLKEMSFTQILTPRKEFSFINSAGSEFVWGHLHHYIESLAHV